MNMKKGIFAVVIISLTLLIGVSMIGCSNSDLDGTWWDGSRGWFVISESGKVVSRVTGNSTEKLKVGRGAFKRIDENTILFNNEKMFRVIDQDSISASQQSSSNSPAKQENNAKDKGKPTTAAKAWARAMQKGDPTALGKISTPESAAKTAAFMSEMQALLASNPAQGYSEQISGDGNTAVVTVTLKNNDTETIKLVKRDGKWLVDE
jgi:hypothetical protein